MVPGPQCHRQWLRGAAGPLAGMQLAGACVLAAQPPRTLSLGIMMRSRLPRAVLRHCCPPHARERGPRCQPECRSVPKLRQPGRRAPALAGKLRLIPH